MSYSANRTEVSLHSGRYVDLLNPQPESFIIEDIARGLANTCRFNGQCSVFYSVAQHSVLVSHLVPDDYKMAALLHDSAESCISDTCTPLKKLIPELKVIEDRIEAAIFKRFGLPFPMPADMKQSVKRADWQALATERRDVTPWGDDYWPLLGDVKPLPTKIKALDSQQAYSQFMDRFYELADSLIFTDDTGI
jgi:5'-deoxynucleotidase YfbR-like HD superfamily hydrolase